MMSQLFYFHHVIFQYDFTPMLGGLVVLTMVILMFGFFAAIIRSDVSSLIDIQTWDAI